MRSLAVLGFLLASIIPALAFDDPRALLESFYAPYMSDDFEDFIEAKANEDDYFSTGLNALFEKDRAEAEAAEGMGRIDFDVFVNGQDFAVTNLVVGVPEVTGMTAKVPVELENFGQPLDLTFSLVREDGDWKIDDVRNDGGEYPYALRAILEGPLP